MEYLEEEKKCREAAERFTAAFSKVENAIVFKSQSNYFGVKIKYPLLLSLCVLLVTVIFVFQFTFELYDFMFIICEVVTVGAMVFFFVLIVKTWFLTMKNAKIAEKMIYYNGDKKCLVTEITDGGTKIEWNGASLYMSGDDFELIESKDKKYYPYFYKRIHGHSRGFRLFNPDNIIGMFFNGATVLSDENGKTVMSSGFTFTIEYDSLKEFEIIGFYDECYENNFPVMSISTQSKNYVFKYEFAAVNVPNFRLILPERSKECAKLFFLELPKDRNIFPN